MLNFPTNPMKGTDGYKREAPHTSISKSPTIASILYDGHCQPGRRVNFHSSMVSEFWQMTGIHHSFLMTFSRCYIHPPIISGSTNHTHSPIIKPDNSTARVIRRPSSRAQVHYVVNMPIPARDGTNRIPELEPNWSKKHCLHHRYQKQGVFYPPKIYNTLPQVIDLLLQRWVNRRLAVTIYRV